jgi:polysaccharide export outer membrane protein
MTRRSRCLAAVLAAAMALAIASCSSNQEPPASNSISTFGADPRIPSVANTGINQQRLADLWTKRTSKDQSGDYPVGAGDVIEVTVPGVDDLKDQIVRVSGNGTLDLPLVGTMQAAGLTEAELRDEIKKALTKYMYDPQVDVFVKEYHSRQVAVIGAVRAPGLVTLNGTTESVLDVITQAGGTTPDAADELVMLPEVQGGAAHMQQVGQSMVSDSGPQEKLRTPDAPSGPQPAGNARFDPAAAQTGIVSVASLEREVSNGPAVVIPLRTNAFTGTAHYLNLPVEPGDVLVIPGGGNVMVTGWVYRPGFFQVGSGLTVLGAVGSAGGAMYAADASNTVLIRSDGSGNKTSIPVDLDKIANGQEPDVPVHANDVINVPYSVAKIGPYVVYNILSKMMVPMPTY